MIESVKKSIFVGMKRSLKFLPALLLFAALGFTAQTDQDAQLLKRAEKLHNKIISIDTHTDTALRLTRENVGKITGTVTRHPS